jgi:DNA modification methylase
LGFDVKLAGYRMADIELAYEKGLGSVYAGSAENFLSSPIGRNYLNKVQLILTSPPFPLNRKKRYGNKTGQEYVDWLASLAPRFCDLLKENGSIILEMGNAWEVGEPVMSTLALEALLAFLRRGGLNLCQQFICYNPARLPSPAQWVTVERIRVKDAYTHVWWMAKSARPKANNRRVLKPYSTSMLKLLSSKRYNSGPRPSEHNIGKTSFLTRNAGAIPSNVLQFTNTGSSDPYLRYCREKKLQPHPARMPTGLAEFFIRFLSQPGDLVLDPFAGSNTTGAVAESLRRQWVGIEPCEEYIRGSVGRFETVNGSAPKPRSSKATRQPTLF